MKKSTWLCFVLLLLCQFSFAQNTTPFPTGNRDFEAISPWGHTADGTAWNTSSYLPFIYRNMWFRFMPPNGVTYNKTTNTWSYSEPTKKYPLILFFQGAGEASGTDNNKQLKHGGQKHMNAVTNGQFPGFLLYPQGVDAANAVALIEKIIATYPVDINRIYVHGLSNGAKWTWDFALQNPKLVAAFAACSGMSATPQNLNMLYTPIRQSQGGLDTNPAPNWTQAEFAWYESQGGQMEYFLFPNLGHGTWDTMYNRSDWFTWFLSQKKNKIYVRYRKNEFCPGSPVSATLGFTPGFEGYEWRKDGVALPNTTNSITVTTYGSYTGRIRNRGVWSDWSDAVVVQDKAPTQTPPIQFTTLQSKYLPDVNGSNSVELTQPAGYETYAWNKSGVTGSIGTSQTITVTGAGSYTATVKEVGGCSSLPSVPFVLVDANGSPKPDPASGLIVSTVNKTTLRLNWENTASPAVNETGFEIYRSETSGGPYDLLTTTAPDVVTYTNSALPSNTRFYYRVRAVAANGAAAATPEASAITDVDITPPTAPQGLTVTSIANNSVGLSWSASTDDVGIVAYDVYVRPSDAPNYVKAYSTTARTQTVFQLSSNVLYNFIVKARDEAGNESPASAMVTAATVFSGLYYSYYEGTWTTLPNFSALTPVSTGTVTNFSLTPAQRADNFGFVFTGTLYVPANNQYTFYLDSDDGSKLWVNNTLVVDYNGLHGTGSEKNGKITLNSGYYPIRAEYFEATSGNSISVKWSSPNINKQNIPNANLKASYTAPIAPAAPTNQAVTVIDYKSLRVNWAAYNGTGTDIEIYRSLNGSSNWSIIATVPKTTSNYTDNNLTASTRYYYRLRAINSGGVSSNSSSQNATTQALPALPQVPTNLATSGITASAATLTWTDNATNEDNYEVYKSVGNNTSYTKVATLGPNINTYTDNTLAAHTIYYYRVLSKNVRGSSAYSNVVNFTTLNNAPVLSGLRDIMLRYDDHIDLPLTAVDLDNDFLVIGGNNLPTFVQIFDDGEGGAILDVEPTQANLGVYENLELFVKDAFGGIQTLIFKVVVNNNHNPVIADVAPITVKESYIANVTANASDSDGDVVTWTVQDAPSFMTYTNNGNNLNLKFQPVATDAGTYAVTLTATDPTGGFDTKVVNVTVSDFDPNFNVKVNFRSDPSYNGPAGWNNVGADPATIALVRENGTSSGLSLQVVEAWSGWKDGYGSTAFGTYPAAVTNSYIYFYGSAPKTLRFTGLNPDGKYNFKFISSNRIADGASRLTTYVANGQTQSVEGNNNNATLVTFTGLAPTAAGVLNVTVAGPSNGYAVVNALVLESFFDGNVAPAAPTNLVVVEDATTSQIKATWTDNSSNELSFELYRSTDNTNFTKVGTLSTDVATYLDASFSYGVTYYYKVRAVNGIGASAYSNTASIVGPNRVPVITPIAPITMTETEFKSLLLLATDVDGDDMLFSLENAPPFVWEEYMANGRSGLMISPEEGNAGAYQFQVRCTDSHGGVGTLNVSLTVTGGSDVFVNVNFTVPAVLAAAPWNNVTTYTAGTVVNNLKNADNVNTTMSLTLQNIWTGTNPNGYTTGNNSGIYPDNVMSNSFFIQDDNARTILIAGLNATKTYDFTFFASRSGVTDVRNTIFASGAKSAILNASSNTSTLATVSGVKPNASGQITLSVSRQSGSQYAYMNSMVIREYSGSTAPVAPAAPGNLSSTVVTKNSVKLIWEDRSDNETGFEIWRSVNNNTSYSLLTTVAAGATTYTNPGLSAPTLYYYKVRAVNEIGSSAYTNESTATTFDFSVSVNFNAFNTGPTTWNNLNAFLNTGAVVTNLKDENGANTGISMTVVQEFAGDNPYGSNTGNNSGVVPDRVMEGSWWIDRTQVATLKFNNLSFLRKYNFSFFGSRAADGDRNTVYIINGNSVTLNSSLNTSNIVQLKNISPDADGSVTVNITTTSTALFGYLNGLIIQAFPASSGGAGGSTADRLAEGSMKAYPNPFIDQFKVDVSSDQNSSKFKVSLLNTTGVVVFEDYLDRGTSEGELEVILKDQLNQGVYMLRVKGNAGNPQTLKLIKK